MNSFLNRPEGAFYIHEIYKNDHIYIYIPYEWCEGKNEHAVPETAPMGHETISRQYLDMMYTTLYASDPVQSANWFNDVLGCRQVEESSTGIVMQISPGAYFMISTDQDSPRSLSLISNHTAEIRERLAELRIELTAQDNNNWFACKGPDDTYIEVWRGGFGMEKITLHQG